MPNAGTTALWALAVAAPILCLRVFKMHVPVLQQRHVSLGVGVLLMLCGGTPYMVSMFGEVFSLRFDLTESNTILVETCAHVGLYLGLTQGLFYDRFGEKWGCLLAGVLLALGYTGVRN